VPTKSVDNAALILATYYVQAYVGTEWLSSPLYLSHGGANSAVNTVFRSDFNLTTDPNSEVQTHANPQWLFRENRSAVAGLSSRVRVIPIASGKGLAINFATMNITFPGGWSYVPGSSYNPYGEDITYYTVSGRDALKWSLNRDVLVYSTNQSMAQNYIEFNVTAPASPGVYNFTVTSLATSLAGLPTGEIQYIYAYVMSSPTASFTYSPLNPLVNQPVNFNASSSSDLDGTISNYFWDFGDSQTGAGATTTHTYPAIGNYTVKLTVTDNDGLTGTMSRILRVIKNPVALFTFSPMLPRINQTVTFNASLSIPNGGYITDYFWDFGDGGKGSGETMTHSYGSFGNFTVTLTITDSEGLNSTQVKIIRIATSPVASFTHSPEQPWVYSTVTFNASSSQDPDNSITTYQWDFGDGNITVVSNSIISHVYNASGSFIVNLTVFDSDGFSGSSSRTLTVVVHDVVVLSVSPSVTELQSGQEVYVTVVVKNEGTTNETFNVTVYYNNTKLETKSVANLAPTAEITLTFVWNTAGLPEGSVFTIRAETSQIPGEIDTIDNSLTGSSSVKISQKSSTPSFWDIALAYAIPVGAVIASLLLFAVVAFLRKPSKQVTSPVDAGSSELQPFIDMIGGELPDSYSVMIVGDASAGKSILCQQLAYRYINQGKPCVYVTYDCLPDEIRENMKNFGWEISSHEQNENFVFVDCYSSVAGKPSREKHFVKQPFALSELGIVMSMAVSELRQKSARIFLDSTAPLFTRLDSAKVVEFLQDRSAQIKGENGIFFFIVGKGTLQEDLRRRLEEIVDCIIDLELREEKGETIRKMHVRKLRGRRFSDQWVSFKIDMKKGFVLSAPKHSQKSQV